MNINTFFRFRNECPICNSLLTREGSIDIMVESNNNPFDIGNVDFAGFIDYNYNGRFFDKASRFIVEDRQKNNLEILFENFPKTFAMKTRFSPRIGKDKLSSLITPDSIYSADLTVMRACYAARHCYRYDSQYMFEGESADNIEIQTEFFDIYNIRISNNFLNEPKTNISKLISKNDYKIFETLPLIPIERWDIKTKSSLISQIEKFALLK